MRLGFHQDFIRSGDLRMFLAMSQDEDMRALFDSERQKDNLIQELEGEQDILTYNMEAKAAGKEFVKRLRDIPVLVNGAGRPLHLGGMYPESTCVIAGSGSSQDIEFVKVMRANNATVISVGNALQDIRPDIWVGLHAPSAYSRTAYQTSCWLSVMPMAHAGEQLWNDNKQEFLEATPKTCPNIAFFNKAEGNFFDTPGITDLGTNSSFITALTTAVCLGFSNIILSGVDLGGTADNYFYFNEVPHKQTAKRKNKAYPRIRKAFAQLNEGLVARSIRVISVVDNGLEIPVIPTQYLMRFMGGVNKLHKAIQPGVSAPPEAKKAQAVKTADRRKALLSAIHLWDKLEELEKELPVFTGPTAEKVKNKLTKQLAQPGGCTGCAKRRMSNPLMRLFVEEYKKDSDNLEDVWQRVFPDQYIMKVNKELVTRSDRADG